MKQRKRLYDIVARKKFMCGTDILLNCINRLNMNPYLLQTGGELRVLAALPGAAGMRTMGRTDKTALEAAATRLQPDGFTSRWCMS
jgi:hypothetical protein